MTHSRRKEFYRNGVSFPGWLIRDILFAPLAPRVVGYMNQATGRG